MKMMNWTQKAQDRDVWKKPISSSGETMVYEKDKDLYVTYATLQEFLLSFVHF